MTARALVLSGGGSVGIAWETGILAGLEEEGVLLGNAGLIIGTSAGSSVGAQLALGQSPAEMVKGQQARYETNLANTAAAPTPATVPNTAGLMEVMARMATDTGTQEERLAAVGRFALEAKTAGEEAFVAGFAARLGEQTGWPEKDFRCTAIDAQTGEFTVWTRDSGVPVARAVASSCAVPGVYPPITINGKRYYDGGIRSASNADLAVGSEVVVIISLIGGGAASSDPRAELARRRVEAETKALRDGGARVVELIGPDDAARASFGLNMLDWRQTAAALEEGIRQGRAEADRVRKAWEAA